MKYYLFLLLIFSLDVSSQQLKGLVLDNETNLPIEYVNVFLNKNNYGVFTNKSGEFFLKDIADNDSIYISCIGYVTNKIRISELDSSLAKNIFILKKNIYQLNDVIVESKIKKYTTPKKINNSNGKNETNYFGFQFGTENCVYIKNEHKSKGKIQSISLDLKKVIDSPDFCKECKVDYVTDFSIKFYKYDKRKKIPGDEIYDKPIIIYSKNKSSILEIKLDTLHIPFLEDGICIGIETINTQYTNPKKVGAFIAPSINFERIRNVHENHAWVRYRYAGKWEFKSFFARDRISKYFDRIKIDVKVKYEKD